jgi:maltose alpha-D-glucosyltransferase/alpha-amylase
VAAQRADPDSLLHQVRRLVRLRRDTPELGTGSPVTVLSAGYPFVYRRGAGHLVVVNPRREPAELALPELPGGEPLLVSGVDLVPGKLRAGGFSYGVFRV